MGIGCKEKNLWPVTSLTNVLRIQSDLIRALVFLALGVNKVNTRQLKPLLTFKIARFWQCWSKFELLVFGHLFPCHKMCCSLLTSFGSTCQSCEQIKHAHTSSCFRSLFVVSISGIRTVKLHRLVGLLIWLKKSGPNRAFQHLPSPSLLFTVLSYSELSYQWVPSGLSLALN